MEESEGSLVEYQQELYLKPVVTARKRVTSGYRDRLTEEHLNMNNGWARMAFGQGQFEYSVQREVRRDPVPGMRPTGQNPSSEDLTAGQLDREVVQRILEGDVDSDLSESVPRMSSVVTTDMISNDTIILWKDTIRISPSLLQSECMRILGCEGTKGTSTLLCSV